MGTTYTVKVNTSQSHYKNDLKSGLDSILVKINNMQHDYFEKVYLNVILNLNLL